MQKAMSLEQHIQWQMANGTSAMEGVSINPLGR